MRVLGHRAAFVKEPELHLANPFSSLLTFWYVCGRAGMLLVAGLAELGMEPGTGVAPRSFDDANLIALVSAKPGPFLSTAL